MAPFMVYGFVTVFVLFPCAYVLCRVYTTHKILHTVSERVMRGTRKRTENYVKRAIVFSRYVCVCLWRFVMCRVSVS